MSNCLNCGDKIIQTPGKREKQYCDSTCRSNFFQKKKRLEKIGFTMPSPAALNIAKEKHRASKGMGKVKKLPAAKTSPKEKYVNHKPQNEPKQGTRPKNLLELKGMCPFPENSDERRVWISIERQKYNI